MKASTFRRKMRETYDMGPAEEALVEAIAQSMERGTDTSSPRDQRAEGRLQNELLRSLFSRLPDDDEDDKKTKSELGRALARQRWGE